MVSGLTFKSLTYFELFLYTMQERGPVSLFLHIVCPVFPTLLVEETVAIQVYIFTSFVID